MAVDGDSATRWNSLWTWYNVAPKEQWLCVDLLSSRAFGYIRLNWDSLSYATEYKISISDDAVTWNDVYYTTTGAGKVEVLSLPPSTARYVRFYGMTSAASWGGYSLWDFEVY